MDNFQTELKDQLAKLGLIDYDVYGPYVMGILVRDTLCKLSRNLIRTN